MIVLTLDNFEREILDSAKPCVVAFKSEGCHLCVGLTRILFRVERRYEKKFKFAVIDSALEQEIFKMFGVFGVPTVFLFINGDGMEIPYPDDPCPFSGYSEEYLHEHLEAELKNE